MTKIFEFLCIDTKTLPKKFHRSRTGPLKYLKFLEILTKHQIIGQLNNSVHKELNVYHKLFCQRYAVGGWYKKCDLLRFMDLESLEFPSDFGTEQMMGILTNPGMYSPAIVAKACLELYIGRYMLILIKVQ